jgi:hypothetical protein
MEGLLFCDTCKIQTVSLVLVDSKQSTHVSSYPGLASSGCSQYKLILELSFIEDRAKGSRWETKAHDPPFEMYQRQL